MTTPAANVEGIPHHGAAGSLVPRLSIMMFLQFFVWGAWYVSMTGFMLRQEIAMGGLIAAAYSVGPIAAIISPFFLGLIADRFLPTQVVLGALHLVGGVFLVLAPHVASPFDAATGISWTHPFILVLLAHMLCYMPTLALTGSLSFRHLPNREKTFPIVRVFGTIGWIVGNIIVSGNLKTWGIDLVWIADGDKSPAQFTIAGSAAILLGLYSFTLPHTAPPSKGQPTSLKQILGVDALSVFSKFSPLVFILCSFLMCIPLAGYYAQGRNYVEATGFTNPTVTMSYGQMSEILFMLVMPLCFLRMGIKWMLAAGMLAWVLRYGLFAGAWNGSGSDHVRWMVLIGILLHGICYDFFFVTGMVYVDRIAPPRMRSQAQGLLVLVTQGLGMLVGAQVFGAIVSQSTKAPAPGVTTTDWQTIWIIPCIAAGAILFTFVALFRDKPAAGEATSS